MKEREVDTNISEPLENSQETKDKKQSGAELGQAQASPKFWMSQQKRKNTLGLSWAKLSLNWNWNFVLPEVAT